GALVLARSLPEDRPAGRDDRRLHLLRADAAARAAGQLCRADDRLDDLAADGHRGDDGRGRQTPADELRVTYSTARGPRGTDAAGSVEQVDPVAVGGAERRGAGPHVLGYRAVGAEGHHARGDDGGGDGLLALAVLVEIHEPALRGGHRQSTRRAAGGAGGEVVHLRRVVEPERASRGQAVLEDVETIAVGMTGIAHLAVGVLRLQRVLAVARADGDVHLVPGRGQQRRGEQELAPRGQLHAGRGGGYGRVGDAVHHPLSGVGGEVDPVDVAARIGGVGVIDHAD